MVIDYPKAIYIMEFKYSPNDKDLSNDALDQIKDKKYPRHISYNRRLLLELVILSERNHVK